MPGTEKPISAFMRNKRFLGDGMTNKILLGASVLALIAAYPAFAQTNAQGTVEADTSAGAQIEETLEKTGAAIESAAEKASAKTKEAYQDVKAYFSNDDDVTAVTSVNVSNAMTSDKLIGQTIQIADGGIKADIEDIFVDENGAVKTVIVDRNGDSVALDGAVLSNVKMNNDNAIIIGKEVFDQATPFKAEAMETGLFSVKRLDGAKILNAEGKAVASAEDIIIEGNNARYVIAAFNQIFNLGGDEIALNFRALELVNTEDKYSFRMNAEQSAQFKAKDKNDNGTAAR
jgi:hypothetical protein